MLFGKKIVCDQCNKKVKEKQSIYRRGSRFCSDGCVVTWEATNPPPTASGPDAQLREEVAMLLDEALVESGRKTSYNPEDSHEVEQVQTSFGLFQSYVLRAAPILRALGFIREATLIDSTDFQRGWNDGYIQYDAKLLATLRELRQAFARR